LDGCWYRNGYSSPISERTYVSGTQTQCQFVGGSSGGFRRIPDRRVARQDMVVKIRIALGFFVRVPV
jgi:hypothetical protein